MNQMSGDAHSTFRHSTSDLYRALSVSFDAGRLTASLVQLGGLSYQAVADSSFELTGPKRESRAISRAKCCSSSGSMADGNVRVFGEPSGHMSLRSEKEPGTTGGSMLASHVGRQSRPSGDKAEKYDASPPA